MTASETLLKATYCIKEQELSQFKLSPFTWICIYTSQSHFWVGSCPQGTFPIVPVQSTSFLFDGIHLFNNYNCFVVCTLLVWKFKLADRPLPKKLLHYILIQLHSIHYSEVGLRRTWEVIGPWRLCLHQWVNPLMDSYFDDFGMWWKLCWEWDPVGGSWSLEHVCKGYILPNSCFFASWMKC